MSTAQQLHISINISARSQFYHLFMSLQILVTWIAFILYKLYKFLIMIWGVKYIWLASKHPNECMPKCIYYTAMTLDSRTLLL